EENFGEGSVDTEASLQTLCTVLIEIPHSSAVKPWDFLKSTEAIFSGCSASSLRNLKCDSLLRPRMLVRRKCY
ncbi:hypothetical protein C0J52_22405, partial [Blattella germanica]